MATGLPHRLATQGCKVNSYLNIQSCQLLQQQASSKSQSASQSVSQLASLSISLFLHCWFYFSGDSVFITAAVCLSFSPCWTITYIRTGCWTHRSSVVKSVRTECRLLYSPRRAMNFGFPWSTQPEKGPGSTSYWLFNCRFLIGRIISFPQSLVRMK